MKKPILNIDDARLMPFGQGNKFAASLGQIGKHIGMEKLGCMVTIVEPGKSAFPFHVHHMNEEMFVILEGQGDYRFGEETYPIKAGDVLAAPPGGAERAHQITNTGSTTLKYLGISTKAQPEVVEYPDSDKFAVFSRSTDGSPMTAQLRFIGRTETTLDYWDGEDA
ncbi:MAG: cupin [Hyphomicrobiales bacterium]|nr:cupin domain-containing protein [Hyphomicrobiales bacterium]PCJ95593.1 MAG: cupin [Hyphomicrobiales bacterium]